MTRTTAGAALAIMAILLGISGCGAGVRHGDRDNVPRHRVLEFALARIFCPDYARRLEGPRCHVDKGELALLAAGPSQ